MSATAHAQLATSAASLGLGTAAYEDIGTSGATVPLNNANITRSGTLTQNDDLLLGAGVQIDFADELGDKLYLFGTTYKISVGSGQLQFSAGVGGAIAFFVDGVPAFQGSAASAIFPTGTAAGPGLVMFGDATTGLYRDGGVVGLSYGGEAKMDASTGGTRIATNGTGGTRIAKLRTEKSTMAAGTTGVIADTPVASTSIILVTPQFAPLGQLYYTISAGVGFTILSTNAADAGSVSWQRVTV